MNRRIKVLKIFIIIILGILILKAGQMQVLMGDYYYELSEINRTTLRTINAPRGKIVDRNNNILVYNKLAYNLYLLPYAISDEFTEEEIIKKTSDLLSGVDYNFLFNNYQIAKERGNDTILLKRNMSKENYVIIKENKDRLPGILVKESKMRDYIYGNLAAHTIGYVGEINREELQEFTRDGYDYRGGDLVGKTGLEKQYELYLKGINGIEQLEVNSHQETIKSLGVMAPIAGNDIILNLDLELQQFVEELLEKEFFRLRDIAEDDEELFPPSGAAVVVMDPNNGAVLASSSYPRFDPSHFVKGLSNEDYQELINNPLKPLENRTIRAEVNPGSIFKLVTGTAALENLGITGDTEFYDAEGVYKISTWEYRNWRDVGEGWLDFTRAIARSNNIVFYKLGHKLYNDYRGEKLASTAREYGFGQRTGIDLPGERRGLVPDNEWKLRTQGEMWYPGNSLHLSIGQIVETTPIQLITMLSSIANGGKLYQPQLVDRIENSEGQIIEDIKPVVNNHLPFQKSTYDTLIQGMVDVTSKSYGTASHHFIDFPHTAAGKTGTAQTGAGGANHGWFGGFAPADEPEVAVLVLLQEGNSSSYAVPIAVEVFKKYFNIETEQDF